MPKLWLTDGTKRLGIVMGLDTCDAHKPPLEHLVDATTFATLRGMARTVGGFDAAFELTEVEYLPIDGPEVQSYYRALAQSKAHLN
jgi:hypothetical protein